MQNKKIKTEIIMLPVPAELFLEAGMFEGDPMQMYADGHKIVIENIDDPKDIVCDGDCENCPIADIRKEKIHATDSGRSTEGGAGNRTDHIGQGEHQKPLSSLACCSILPSFHEARGTTQQL